MSFSGFSSTSNTVIKIVCIPLAQPLFSSNGHSRQNAIWKSMLGVGISVGVGDGGIGVIVGVSVGTGVSVDVGVNVGVLVEVVVGVGVVVDVGVLVGVRVRDGVAVSVGGCGVGVEVLVSGKTSPTCETSAGVEKPLHPASRPIQNKNRIPRSCLIRD